MRYLFGLLIGLALWAGLSGGAYLAFKTDLALAMYPQLREARRTQTPEERERLDHRNAKRLRAFVLIFLVLAVIVGAAFAMVLPNK